MARSTEAPAAPETPDVTVTATTQGPEGDQEAASLAVMADLVTVTVARGRTVVDFEGRSKGPGASVRILRTEVARLVRLRFLVPTDAALALRSGAAPSVDGA